MAQLDVARLKSQASRLFDGFTRGQKTMMALAVAAVFIGVYVLASSGGGQSNMAPLYTDLPVADASAITEKLDAAGVSYELVDGGTTILVPRERVYELRLDMSAEGLPAGGNAGYSLLDKQGITTSQFRQRVDYQRALEGELSRTIQSLDAVESATVHLVIPRDDVFAGDESQSSASVLVRTAGSNTLTPMQVQAIVNLVASSVEGLSPDMVTVADSKGVVLSAPGGDASDAVTNDLNLRQRTAFQNSLASSIEAMVGKVVGPDRVKVTVSADMDFDRATTTSERYEQPEVPAGTQPLAQSEISSNETYTGPASGTVGILGPEGEQPTDAAGANTPTNYQKTDVQREFALDRTIEERQQGPGEVRRLSVAVLVDAAAVDATAVADIEALVASAAGIDAERGDVVRVTRLDFDTTAAADAETEVEGATASTLDIAGLARTVGAVIVVLLVLFFSWRSARKVRRARAIALPIDLRELGTIKAELESLVERDGHPELRAGAHDATEMLPSMLDDRGQLLPVDLGHEDMARVQMEAEINELVDRQPEDVAALLRSWLSDRRTAGRR